jgi:hypothetical protein
MIISQNNPFLQSPPNPITQRLALSTKPSQTIIITQDNPFLQFSSKSNYTKARSLYQTNTNHHHLSKQSVPPILLQIHFAQTFYLQKHATNITNFQKQAPIPPIILQIHFYTKKPRRESLPKTNTQDNIEILF